MKSKSKCEWVLSRLLPPVVGGSDVELSTVLSDVVDCWFGFRSWWSGGEGGLPPRGVQLAMLFLTWAILFLGMLSLPPMLGVNADSINTERLSVSLGDGPDSSSFNGAIREVTSKGMYLLALKTCDEKIQTFKR